MEARIGGTFEVWTTTAVLHRSFQCRHAVLAGWFHQLGIDIRTQHKFSEKFSAVEEDDKVMDLADLLDVLSGTGMQMALPSKDKIHSRMQRLYHFVLQAVLCSKQIFIYYNINYDGKNKASQRNSAMAQFSAKIQLPFDEASAISGHRPLSGSRLPWGAGTGMPCACEAKRLLHMHSCTVCIDSSFV